MLALLLVLTVGVWRQRQTSGESANGVRGSGVEASASGNKAVELADAAMAKARAGIHAIQINEGNQRMGLHTDPVEPVKTPQPVVTLITNKSMGVTRIHTFPQVLDIHGMLIATDARLVGFAEGAVFFLAGASGQDPKPQYASMDMDRLPPSFFGSLGLDKEALKKTAEAEQEKRRREEKDRREKAGVIASSVKQAGAVPVVQADSYERKARDEAAFEAELEMKRKEIDQMYAIAASVRPPPQRYRVINMAVTRDYCTTCHPGKNISTLGPEPNRPAVGGLASTCPACNPSGLLSSLEKLHH